MLNICRLAKADYPRALAIADICLTARASVHLEGVLSVQHGPLSWGVLGVVVHRLCTDGATETPTSPIRASTCEDRRFVPYTVSTSHGSEQKWRVQRKTMRKRNRSLSKP